MSEDRVITPGGLCLKSNVHIVKPGQAVTKVGASLRKFEVSSKSLRAQLEANVFNWITFAAWTNETGKVISSFKTTWTAPPPPATQSGQLIYLFNGLQDSLGTQILQPVLQWGVSPDGGDNFWAVASWYVDSSNRWQTPLVPVNEGDVLTGVITLQEQSENSFSYICEFKGINGTDLLVPNISQLVMPVEVLECYAIQQCSDYPNTDKTSMTSIEVKTGNEHLMPNWAVENRINDCGQRTVVKSNYSLGGAVDIFYA